eukprot:scaffold8110_cov403-Prasinococcus_capsulatus_cf.AAC.4
MRKDHARLRCDTAHASHYLQEDSINSHNAELNKLRRLLASKSNAWEHAMSELVCATPVMRGNRWSVFHSPNHSQSGEAAVIGNATDDNGAAVVKAASDTATQDEAQALAVVIEAKLRMESTESEHDGIATSATTEGIGGAGPDSPAPLTESWSQKTSTVSDEVTYLQGSSETAEHVEASPHGDTQPAPTLPHWMTSSGRMRRGFQAQRSSSDISELRGSPRTDMVAGRDSSTDGSHTATDSMQASRGSYDDLHTLALEGGMVGKASSHPVLRSTSTRSERSASTKPRRGTTLLMRLTGMWSSSLVRMGYCFLPTSQEDLVVPIFDMEVSSAVAYALSTTAYADRLVTAKRMLRSSSADDMSSRSDTNTETNPSNPSEDAGWSSAAYIDGHGGNETQMHSMKRSDRGKNNSMDDAESEIHLLSEKVEGTLVYMLALVGLLSNDVVCRGFTFVSKLERPKSTRRCKGVLSYTMPLSLTPFASSAVVATPIMSSPCSGVGVSGLAVRLEMHDLSFGAGMATAFVSGAASGHLREASPGHTLPKQRMIGSLSNSCREQN